MKIRYKYVDINIDDSLYEELLYEIMIQEANKLGVEIDDNLVIHEPVDFNTINKIVEIYWRIKHGHDIFAY